MREMFIAFIFFEFKLWTLWKGSVYQVLLTLAKTTKELAYASGVAAIASHFLARERRKGEVSTQSASLWTSRPINVVVTSKSCPWTCTGLTSPLNARSALVFRAFKMPAGNTSQRLILDKSTQSSGKLRVFWASHLTAALPPPHPAHCVSSLIFLRVIPQVSVTLRSTTASASSGTNCRLPAVDVGENIRDACSSHRTSSSPELDFGFKKWDLHRRQQRRKLPSNRQSTMA